MHCALKDACTCVWHVLPAQLIMWHECAWLRQIKTLNGGCLWCKPSFSKWVSTQQNNSADSTKKVLTQQNGKIFIINSACPLGLAGTYKGLTPTILKQGSNQAIRFFVYSNLKKYFQGGDNSKDIGNIRTFCIGGVAGAASVFGNTPIDVVKTRMQVCVLNELPSRRKWLPNKEPRP